MFTGLIEEGGRIAEIRPADQGARLVVSATLVLEGLEIGDSVAVNGTCLTAVEITPTGFAVDAVAETLRRTSLGALTAGDRVNLERPMRLGDLAARESVSPPTLTRIVAALEEAGLVVRETDPDDRRAVRVAATDEGAALTAGVRSARSAALHDRMLALTPAERAALLAAVPVIEALAGDEG